MPKDPNGETNGSLSDGTRVIALVGPAGAALIATAAGLSLLTRTRDD